MALGQSPPTTSGIIVITGSNSFDPQTSDYPVVVGIIETAIKKGAEPVIGTVTFDDFANLVFVGTVISVDKLGTAAPVLGSVLDLTSDVEIRTTPVTTSGIVVMDMFIGAGAVFVVPVVGNARIFPVFAGVFPQQDRRIFPVLPQFSTLTPGD